MADIWKKFKKNFFIVFAKKWLNNNISQNRLGSSTRLLNSLQNGIFFRYVKNSLNNQRHKIGRKKVSCSKKCVLPPQLFIIIVIKFCFCTCNNCYRCKFHCENSGRRIKFILLYNLHNINRRFGWKKGLCTFCSISVECTTSQDQKSLRIFYEKTDLCHGLPFVFAWSISVWLFSVPKTKNCNIRSFLRWSSNHSISCDTGAKEHPKYRV